MKRPVLLALLGALALPAAAQAAQVKISPRASAVSAAGVATVEVANPTRHALRGTAAVTAGGRTVAKRSVRLPKRSVTSVKLRFDAVAMAALRDAAGRATIKLALGRGAGGRKTTARRTLTLRLPAGGQQGPGAPAPGPTPGGDSGGSNGGQSAPPASDRWVGRMGTEGPYDDFELTVGGGQLQITKPPFVPVMCFENGGSYRSALSLELFDAPGPWTVGTDGDVAKQGLAVNQLVSSGARTITYKVTDTRQEAGRVTGTLGMSYFDSKLDILNGYTMIFINCFGSQSFEAVPAG
jgi:hypothetical protein